jgi:EAL domain-containing protein (putative c-di-GMP-specific phosphodiesterase class I)
MAVGGMNIVFQPVVDLRRGVIAGAEALARFAVAPVRPPDVWFGEAWDVDLGVELELYAIGRALASFRELPEGSHLAINASPATLVSPLLDAVLEGVPGHRLIVELTEHAQVDDYRNVKAAIASLRLRGIRLAIDDAGAGFSSLQHILHLRPDLIKLDRSLTQGIDADPVRYALAAALVTFASSLDAAICAEGIEKDAELAALQHLGIAYGQGYFLGRPLPLPLATPPRGVWLSEAPSEDRHLHSLRPLRAVRVPCAEPREADVGDAAGAPAAFDRVTRWASRLLRVPFALFSVRDERDQVLASSVGIPDASPRADERRVLAECLCHHVAAANAPLVIPDTRCGSTPPGRAPAPLAEARAYLGVPVRAPSGASIGVLSVMDIERRAWSSDDVGTLHELACSLASELELEDGRRRARAGSPLSVPPHI